MALTGGWHCAGMCGAIAALNKKPREIFFYQGGRALSYLLLGSGSGLIGHQFYTTWNHSQNFLPSLIILLLGSLIIFWGNLGEKLSKILWKLIPQKKNKSHHFFLGLANGLLPCHVLYGFLAMAAASGSAFKGLAILFMLWLGSSPYLFAFSLLGEHLLGLKKQKPQLYQLGQIILFLALLLNLVGHHFKTPGH
jgi:uncharacterized protein